MRAFASSTEKNEIANELNLVLRRWKDRYKDHDVSIDTFLDVFGIDAFADRYIPLDRAEWIISLIETPKCVNLSANPMNLRCSRCEMTTYDVYGAKFCPRCGSEVISNEND